MPRMGAQRGAVDAHETRAERADPGIQIWSMKKEEDAAAKKKPKTSAAQIRVQKGERAPHGCMQRC